MPWSRSRPVDELRADLLRRLAKFLPMEESSAAATSSLSTTKRTAAAPLAPIATTAEPTEPTLVQLVEGIKLQFAQLKLALAVENEERKKKHLGDGTQMAEALTHVGGVSLFLETFVEPAKVVSSAPPLMELDADHVLTHVGGAPWGNNAFHPVNFAAKADHLWLTKIPSWQRSAFSPWLGNNMQVVPRQQEGIYPSTCPIEARRAIARKRPWDPGDVAIYECGVFIPSSAQFIQNLLKNTPPDKRPLNLVLLSAEGIQDTLMCLLLAAMEGSKTWADQRTKTLNFNEILQGEQAGYSPGQIIHKFMSTLAIHLQVQEEPCKCRNLCRFFGMSSELEYKQWDPGIGQKDLECFVNKDQQILAARFQGCSEYICDALLPAVSTSFKWHYCSFSASGCYVQYKQEIKAFMESTFMPLLGDKQCFLGAVLSHPYQDGLRVRGPWASWTRLVAGIGSYKREQGSLGKEMEYRNELTSELLSVPVRLQVRLLSTSIQGPAATTSHHLSSCVSSSRPDLHRRQGVLHHPFLFLIQEDLTGVVLFIGHVANPLDSS